MNDVTLVLPEAFAQELATAAADTVETAAVIVAGIAREGKTLRLLARELHWVAEDCYDKRTAIGLSIRPDGYVQALRRAEQIGAVAIWLHTHPHGEPVNSPADDIVDGQLHQLFEVRTGQPMYASMVVGPSGTGSIRFSGRILDDGVERKLGSLWIVGRRFRLLSAVDADDGAVPAIFDRQVRALGPDLQRTLTRMKVGLVGAGGTGSAVGEQLARLGVGRLLVIDHDTLSASNVTRVHGSGIADVGRAKVDVLADHVAQIGLGTEVETIAGTILDVDVASRLRECDLVFGCTDDNAGRVVLSRFSSYYLTPVIDCGVLVSSSEGLLTGIHGRVTVLSAGYGCLICRGRIDLARASVELMPAEQREELAAEGYAPGLAMPGVEPAVVAYTTLVAALAVNEMIERLVGYGADPSPSEMLARLHDRELSTNTRAAKEGHYCADNALQRGAGDRAPMLEMTWVSGSF